MMNKDLNLTINQSWHYFMQHGNEYLVLGYTPNKHNVMCVSLQHLHEKDKEDLLWIVDNEAQKEAYLVSILVKHPYAGGGTWWERLYPRIFFTEMAHVEKLIPPAQVQVFMDAYRKYKQQELLDDAVLVHHRNDVPVECVEENSTTEPTKTENIDDILFGAVLSVDDREEMAELKRLAGIL